MIVLKLLDSELQKRIAIMYIRTIDITLDTEDTNHSLGIYHENINFISFFMMVMGANKSEEFILIVKNIFGLT